MENIPKDRYNIVCIAFYLMGVGTLMPWNLFINGKYSKDISNHYQKNMIKIEDSASSNVSP